MENYTVYAISRQPKWYNNGLRMQEKSLESTEIFKTFPGEHTAYPPSISRLRRSLFHSKHFMAPNPLQWNPATGLELVLKLDWVIALAVRVWSFCNLILIPCQTILQYSNWGSIKSFIYFYCNILRNEWPYSFECAYDRRNVFRYFFNVLTPAQIFIDM